MGRTGRRARIVAVAGGVAALALAVAVLSLVRDVVQELRALNSARSDNVQWTLSQAEVELAGLRAALARASEDPARLGALRQAFDILYSRISILAESRLYAPMAEDPAYAAALAEARAFLDAAVPVIDGPNAELAAAAGALAARADALVPALRTLSTSGLARYTAEADARREGIATTLLRLAVLAGVLLAALTLLLGWLVRLLRDGAAQRRALEEASARMRTILGTSLDGVVVSDVEGRILDFNAAAEAMFGHARADVLGRPVGDVIVPPAMRAAHEAGMARMAATGETRVVGSGRVRLPAMRKGGEEFPAELALQTAQDEGRTIVVAYLRDITEAVAAEEELTRARDRALAGEKAKADFLAVMSHEIRTPLNGLLGSLELLGTTPLAHDQQRLVRNMRVSGEVLLGHVSDVLDIARLEAGKMALSPVPTDPRDLLREVAESMSGAAQSAGNALSWDWLGAPPGWRALDAPRLRQVLLNLVSNAVKFTEGGDVTLEGEVLADGRIELRVADTGIGLPEGEIARVFEDFETRDASYGRTRGGTGLGLGIARRLVAAMGGEIGAESEEGAGSLFWVRLPAPPAEAPVPEAPHGPARAPAPLDVLLVEDNAINREVAAEMLRRGGHSVTAAEDGKAGVAAAAARPFDLILMDISMPVMDGRAATRAIREGAGPNAATPIVALTANVLPEDLARFREDGMQDALPKPLTMAALRDMLAGVAAPAAPPAGPLDAAQLDEARAGVGDAALRRLLARFEAEMAAALEDFPEGAAGADLAHRLAGSAALFGATELRAALLRAERALRAGEGGDARADVAAAWARTAAALADAA